MTVASVGFLLSVFLPSFSEDDEPPLIRGVKTYGQSAILVKGRRIPIPGYLPFGAVDWSTDSIESYPNSWWFDFGIGNDCSGQHVCNEGSFYAERVTPDLSKQLEILFANSALREVDILERPPYVTGYYIPGSCGAYCADSMLLWQSQNMLYMISTKSPNDSPESILDLKKSALSFIKPNLKPEKITIHSTQSIKSKKEARLHGVWLKHQYIMAKDKKSQFLLICLLKE